MKPTIISIPSIAASEVLKRLHVNGIDCKYIGLDQSGKILMEISYTDNQNKLIAELTAYMDKAEQMVSEIARFIKELIDKQREEQLQELAELKKKYQSKQTSETI